VEDTGDGNANTGTLTPTSITGLDMTGGTINYDSFATLNVGLGSGGDTFTIEGTHTGATNVNGNNGDDTFNVKAISGATTVSGGNDHDTFNVGNAAGLLDDIDALLTINGGSPDFGSDYLYAVDSGDTSDNTGTLTSTTLSGLGMAVGINYGTVEHLIISLGSGNDTFTIESTHGAATSPFQEETFLNTGAGTDTVTINSVTDKLFVNGQANADTINVNGTGVGSISTLNGDDGDDVVNVNHATGTVTVNGGAGADTVNINDLSGVLVVNGQDDGDTINVYGTGTGSTSTLNGDGGNDVFNVRAMNGTVAVNGGANDDVVNVGSDAPALPGAPTSKTGTIDAINELLSIDGGADSDTLNVDDSDPANDAKSGTLTSSTIRGLALEDGIDYTTLETLNIWLAFGDNTFTIDSTHAGQTAINTAQGEDTVDINGASGTLTINAELGNDTFNVRATGLGSTVNLNGQAGNDTFNLRASASAVIDSIDGLVVINGGADTDVINVDDSANSANKVGTLTSSMLRGLEMPAA
jgi:hypothetical protein